MRIRVVVPYDDVNALQRKLDAALDLAEQHGAEIVLLRVNPPLAPGTGTTDHQLLYSELKALQARLEGLPTSVSVRVGSAPWLP